LHAFFGSLSRFATLYSRADSVRRRGRWRRRERKRRRRRGDDVRHFRVRYLRVRGNVV